MAVVQSTATAEGSAYIAEASISKTPTSATHLRRKDLCPLSPAELPFRTIYPSTQSGVDGLTWGVTS